MKVYHDLTALSSVSLSPSEQRLKGYNAYIAGQPFDSLNTAEERLGYKNANRCEADCETVGYLASRTAPPSYNDRAGESIFLMQAEANARWRKRELEDLQEARRDEEFNRLGC